MRDQPAAGRKHVIAIMLGLPLTTRGPAYTAMQLARTMASDDVAVEIHTGLNHLSPTLGPVAVEGPRLRGPAKLRHLAYRIFKRRLASSAERKLLRRLKRRDRPDIIYTFGETSLDFTRACKEQGAIVVREKINCGKARARDILHHLEDYGIPLAPSLNDEYIAKEKQELDLSDAVFVASPMVADSLVAIGIPPAKILESSYGWEPDRLMGTHRMFPAIDGITLVFVGFICHGKGAHILLEAWAKAGLKGRLILAGKMEPQIAERFPEILARDDVIVLPYTEDIGAVFRSADWFIFPSLAEGGPQVTYEAGANGVPALVSEMGAGAFTRDGQEGIVVRQNDVDTWAALIASLPSRAADRPRYAAAALDRSRDFTWEVVGAKRRQMLVDRFLGGTPADA